MIAMRNSTFLRNQATVLVRQRSILGARGGHCWLRWGALLATLILFPSLSLGTATPQLLRVSDALRLAEENGAITVRSQNDLFRTESRRVQAEQWLSQNPYFTFLGGYRRETTSDPVGTGFQYQIHLEQSLEVFGQRSARRSVASAQREVAQTLLAAARLDSRAQVLSAYVRSVLLAQQVEVSRRRESLAAQLLESARTRRDLGAASDVEVNLAQIEIGRVSANVTEAELLHQTQVALLKQICGLRGEDTVQLVAIPDRPVSGELVLDPDHLRALSEQNRPELQTLQRRKLELTAERTRLSREASPLVVASVDLQRDLPGQMFFGGTLGLTLPIWNRNQGPLALVSAEERALQAEQRLLALRIDNEVTLSRRKLLLLRDTVVNYQRDILPPAEQNVELLRRGWQAGKFDLFRVITASRELAEAHIHFLSLQRDLWDAAIELERAVGTPLLTGGLS